MTFAGWRPTRNLPGNLSPPGRRCWGCYIEAFYSPTGGNLALGWFSYPFSVLWIVFIINAVNLLDGLDGLAGGISLITIAGFLLLTVFNEQVYLMYLALAMAGAILGFLRYNYRPASIFMGDVGSLMLGYVLACFSVETLKIAGSQQVLPGFADPPGHAAHRYPDLFLPPHGPGRPSL